jgi:predicted RNase H-like HicB family nuclease
MFYSVSWLWYCFYKSYYWETAMKKEFTVVIERDEEGYYVAVVPALKGCHTQAKSLDVLMVRIKEVISLCLEVQKKPSPKTHLVGVQTVEVTV